MNLNNMFKPKFDYKKLNEDFAHACLIGDINTVQNIYSEHKPNKSIFSSFLKIINIENSFNPNYRKNRALINACMMGRSNIVEFLFKQEEFKKKLPNSQILLALQFAIIHGEVDVIKLLLPLTKKNQSLYVVIDLGLEKACHGGHLDAIKYLTINPELDLDELEKKYILSDQAPIKYKGFLNAGVGGQVEVMKFLSTSPELKNKVNIDRINQPYVSIKMEVNSLEVMNYFIFELGLKRNDPLTKNLTIDPKIIKDVELIFDKQELFKDLNIEFNNQEEKTGIKKKSKL